MTDLDQYDYDLPPEQIAQQPLADRTAARLLVVDRAAGTLEHRHIRDLPDLLYPGDVLVANDSRVVPARLIGRREATGGAWEGLFLGESAGRWQLLSQTRGKLQPGEFVVITNREGRDAFRLELLSKDAEAVWTARPDVDRPAFELLEQAGRVPLPPYIRGGQMQPGDIERYQTVYAARPGSVAAPTAGLHFTAELRAALTAREIGWQTVTLHVGIGTFRPISAERLDEHVMHHEWGELARPTAQRLAAAREAGGRIIAVGTTTVRVLESAGRSAGGWSGSTDLFIRPPYEFTAIDALLTNFHLPRSTLLVLVRTFGDDALIRRAYDEAIHAGYRFYSYGDAMLIV